MPLGSVSGRVASHREPVVIVSDKEADPRYVPIAALRGRDFVDGVGADGDRTGWSGRGAQRTPSSGATSRRATSNCCW